VIATAKGSASCSISMVRTTALLSVSITETVSSATLVT